jgi:DNA-binding SARP family transcriptional activator
MLRIRLLGPVAIVHDRVPAFKFASHKSRALLGYLVLSVGG